LGRTAKSLSLMGGIVIIVLLSLIFNVGVPSSQGGKLTIAATFFPLYDWASNIAGNKATVVNLTPPGMDPHDLDPTPQDLATIISSSLFIYSGVVMEPWVEKLLPTLDRTRTVVVDVTVGIDIIYSAKGQPDPHFWLDPVASMTAVENIELGIEQADPVNAGYYRQNSQYYLEKLKALNAAFAANLSSARVRTFITFHEAFGYWKRAYNLTEMGIYGFEPQGEPSAAHIQEIVSLAKKYRITTVLASNLDDPHWCQVLADQIGGKVLVLDPLEGPTLEQSQIGNYTYIGRLYHDIAVLKEALS
jgi:zinc transport system substrate-binding protein